MHSFASSEIAPCAITYAARSATEAAQLPAVVVATDDDADELPGDGDADDTGS